MSIILCIFAVAKLQTIKNYNIFLTMTYFKRIQSLTKSVNPEVVDFSAPRDEARMPTQASSEFITNKEQGDWAETVLFEAINKASKNYVAVHYGKSDNLVAGDDGFDEFFQSYQNELDTIGKRPDLLIFKRSDFDESLGYDISHIEHSRIDDYVRKAVAGIEVRSSAFLIEHYEAAIVQQKAALIQEAMQIKNDILLNHKELLLSDAKKSVYFSTIESITEENIRIISFKVPGWRSTPELSIVNEKIKRLKECINKFQKRDFLSITPKVEDIKIVYKWIESFNVPHYYFQVFFDKIYGISFEEILTLISTPEKEGEVYFIESDIKNQNKTTIKIHSNTGALIASKVDEPNHESRRKELQRGRLLFYVTFKGGTASLDIENLKNILGIQGEF